MEHWNLYSDENRKSTSCRKNKTESRDVLYRGGDTRSSDEVIVIIIEQRGIIIQLDIK